MDNSEIPKKVFEAKFHGRRPVGIPRLRWEENIRRDSLLPLNIRCRRLAGDRDIWISGGELLRWPGPAASCRAIEDEEDEKEEDEEEEKKKNEEEEKINKNMKKEEKARLFRMISQ
jgi:hypothetical protein